MPPSSLYPKVYPDPASLSPSTKNETKCTGSAREGSQPVQPSRLYPKVYLDTAVSPLKKERNKLHRLS